MKFKRSELKRIIIEEIEKDPALVKAIAALTDTIDGLDMSVDFLAAAVTGENPLSISRAQSTLGRAYRPTSKGVPAPEAIKEEETWPEKEGSGELDEEKENNPWAICTAQVGREDKEKYEKCVKSVKKQNGGE